MKIDKSKISNLLFLVLILVILFTPIGTHVKVFVNRIFAFTPGIESVESREVLKDYNWKLLNQNGEHFNLESVKGEILLINLWATWCPPCIAEMPSFQKLYTDYGDQVTFLFVSNEKQEVTTNFAEKHNYTFPVYSALANAPAQLSSSSIPASYLINKSGEIVINEKGAANWNSDSVRELLDNLIKD